MFKPGQLVIKRDAIPDFRYLLIVMEILPDGTYYCEHAIPSTLVQHVNEPLYLGGELCHPKEVGLVLGGTRTNVRYPNTTRFHPGSPVLWYHDVPHISNLLIIEKITGNMVILRKSREIWLLYLCDPEL